MLIDLFATAGGTGPATGDLCGGGIVIGGFFVIVISAAIGLSKRSMNAVTLSLILAIFLGALVIWSTIQTQPSDDFDEQYEVRKAQEYLYTWIVSATLAVGSFAFVSRRLRKLDAVSGKSPIIST